MKAIDFKDKSMFSGEIHSPKKDKTKKIICCVGALALVVSGAFWIKYAKDTNDNIDQIKTTQIEMLSGVQKWSDGTNRLADSVEALAVESMNSNKEMKAILIDSTVKSQEYQVEILDKIDVLSADSDRIASSIEVLAEEAIKSNAEASKMRTILEEKEQVISNLNSRLSTIQRQNNNLNSELANAKLEVEKIKADNQGFFSKLF